jgi:hypothetical protein
MEWYFAYRFPRMSFLAIDLIAQSGEDIDLAVNADKRRLLSVQRAGWLNRRLSRWIVEDDGKHLSLFKKPKKRWMIVLILAILFFILLH